MPASTPMVHVQTRCVEMTSKFVFDYDSKKGVWASVVNDTPVSEKFNAWADQHDMNPAMTPNITIHEAKETYQNDKGETIIRCTKTYLLCAAAITRVEQASLELSYRQQIAMLIHSKAATPATSAAEPITTALSPEASPQTPPVPDVPTPATPSVVAKPLPEPKVHEAKGGELDVVDVTDTAEEAPHPPAGKPNFPMSAEAP